MTHCRATLEEYESYLADLRGRPHRYVPKGRKGYFLNAVILWDELPSEKRIDCPDTRRVLGKHHCAAATVGYPPKKGFYYPCANFCAPDRRFCNMHQVMFETVNRKGKKE